MWELGSAVGCFLETHVGDVEGFRVGWREMLPAACAGCGYPVEGLPEPRCPECGERVEEGEVVIVGSPSPDQLRTFRGETWGKELRFFGMISVVGWVIFCALDGVTVAGTVICIGMFLLGATISGLVWRRRRLIGYPLWVLRLNAAGYCLGAGSRIGKRREWSEQIRVEVIRRGERVEFRGVQFSGRIALWNAFDVWAVVREGQLQGVMERVQRWGRGKVKVRRRGWGNFE